MDLILQSIGRDHTKDISFTVAKSDLEETLRIIEEHREEIGGSSISYSDQVAKVSVVGAGMTSNPGIASKVFEALYNAQVNIQMISTSEIKISVLIDKDDVDVAVRSIHDQFKLYQNN